MSQWNCILQSVGNLKPIYIYYVSVHLNRISSADGGDLHSTLCQCFLFSSTVASGTKISLCYLHYNMKMPYIALECNRTHLDASGSILYSQFTLWLHFFPDEIHKSAGSVVVGGVEGKVCRYWFALIMCIIQICTYIKIYTVLYRILLVY